MRPSNAKGILGKRNTKENQNMNPTNHTLQPCRPLRRPLCRLRALAALPVTLCALGAAATLPLVSTTTPALAQESAATSATTSRLTGVKLPAGVSRITDKDVSATGLAQIKRVADGGGLSLGQTEHLGWTGKGHTAGKNAPLVKASVAALEAADYTYKVVTEKKVEAGTMSYFLAIHQKKNQAILGCWTAGENFLVLNWGEVSKGGHKAKGEEQKASEEKASEQDEESEDSGKTRAGAQESGAPTR